MEILTWTAGALWVLTIGSVCLLIALARACASLAPLAHRVSEHMIGGESRHVLAQDAARLHELLVLFGSVEVGS